MAASTSVVPGAGSAAFAPLSAQRLLVIGGIALIAGGMLFGDIFAVFVLHQNGGQTAQALLAATEAVRGGDALAVKDIFASIGGLLEDRGTKVDAHVHMTSSAHGNERTFRDTHVALNKDGVIIGITSRHIDDCGAYPRYEPLGCVIWSQVFSGVYRFKNARIEFSQAVTNKCPVGPNRGYSRMQHLWFLERVVDICAHELGIPADEMRLRNYIRPEEFPYTTPNGCIYDSGNYPKMLELAKKLIGWDAWKLKQAEARKQGRMIGIGIGTTLDSGTNNFGQSQIVNPGAPFSGNSQGASCKLDIYGEVVVAVGSCPQGQGHETTAAQVVADVLGITPDLITVRTGFDTERNVHTGFSGTYASQFAVSGLSAVHGAAQKLKAEMKRLAAFVLETSEDDLDFGVGAQGPELKSRKNGKSINYWGLANIVNVNSAVLPVEMHDVTLNCRYIWRAPFKVPDTKRKYGNLTMTYASQLHIAVIEVDRETFIPKILDYVAIDDCGTVINPPIVEGQVYGATAHGIGAALLENCVYDAVGNMGALPQREVVTWCSDASVLSRYGVPTVNYGPSSGPRDKEGEKVKIDTLVNITKIYALTAAELCGVEA